MEKTNSNNYLSNIKSKYIVINIFDILLKKKSFEIIKYNKTLQNKIDIDINTYKEYSTTEIEINLAKNIYGNFINMTEKKEPYFHIYFNNSRKEMKKYSINDKDKIKKIKILIYKKKIKTKGLFQDCKCIESISIKSYRSIFNDMKYLFNNCTSLKRIEFIHINTENTYDMSGMFNHCISLEEIIFSDFKTEKVTSMNGMFSGCTSLKSLNLSTFNTENVKDMSFMFNYCQSLKELNISSFNTRNVESMSALFCNCELLTSLNLSNFHTENVTCMDSMFYNCYSLKELNISDFNIENVEYMVYMFSGCKSLINVNISNFIIKENTKVRGMFKKCSRIIENKIRALNEYLKDEDFMEEEEMIFNY